MKERQLTFAGGEFDPKLYGRTDLRLYAAGAKVMHNFFVEPSGALSNRAGTQYIAKLFTLGVNESVPDDAPVKLIPFVFGEDDALILAVIRRGEESMIAVFKKPSSPSSVNSDNADVCDFVRNDVGAGVYINTPYETVPVSSLEHIKTAQIGNVMTFVHPDHSARDLRRLTTDSKEWSMEHLNFDVGAFPAYGGIPRVLADGIVDNLDANSRGDFSKIAIGDALHEPAPWQWAVTRIMVDSEGRYFETKPFFVTDQIYRRYSKWQVGITYNAHNHTAANPFGRVGDDGTVYLDDDRTIFYSARTYHESSAGNKPVPGGNTDWYAGTITSFSAPSEEFDEMPDDVVVSTSRPIRIDWDELPHENPTLPGADDFRIVTTRIYRGQSGYLGYIGETERSFFVDKGETPDFANPPPSGQNPFKVYDADGNLLRTEQPSVVAYYQNRRYLGRTNERPATFWGSAVGAYNNFDEIVPADDADSLSAEIASKRLERIQNLVPRRPLLALSASAEWAITGSQGELVTPLSVAAYPMSQHGCSNLDPLDIQGTILFMTFKGTTPMALLYSNEGGGYRAMDLARTSKHLFIGHSIVSWAYSEDPYPGVWAVRDDGVLLHCSISIEEQLIAWSRHNLTGGLAQSVAVIPEGSEDAVYAAVLRGKTYSLERMTSRVITDIRKANFLDAAVTKGLSTTSELLLILTSNGAAGEERAVDAELTVDFYTDATTRDAAPANIGEVLQIEDSAGGEAGRIEVVEDTGGGTMRCVVLTAIPDAVVIGAATTGQEGYTRCFKSVNGLDHLEGEEVMALTDGYVAGPFTVQGGAVALDDYAAIATVGLSYVSSFESLDMVGDKSKSKNCNRVHVETEGARGGYIGSGLDMTMDPLTSRDVADSYGVTPMRRESDTIDVSSEWREKACVAVKQTDPLPITILGLTRDVVIGRD